MHVFTDSPGTCPTEDADKDGDGVVITTEGASSDGAAATTLSTSGDTSTKAAFDLKVAGMGDRFSHERTFEMNDKAIKVGNGTVVVRGLDPATLIKKAAKAKSDLNPDLPLAETSPALRGSLSASQMDMPIGNPEIGGDNTAGMDHHRWSMSNRSPRGAPSRSRASSRSVSSERC